jgi:hypothetical protein
MAHLTEEKIQKLEEITTKITTVIFENHITQIDLAIIMQCLTRTLNIEVFTWLMQALEAEYNNREAQRLNNILKETQNGTDTTGKTIQDIRKTINSKQKGRSPKDKYRKSKRSS